MDMTSRTQPRFGPPGTPERRERDPASLASEIAPESLPWLFLACGSQDLFVWDVQIVQFMDLMAPRWPRDRR